MMKIYEEQFILIGIITLKKQNGVWILSGIDKDHTALKNPSSKFYQITMNIKHNKNYSLMKCHLILNENENYEHLN